MPTFRFGDMWTAFEQADLFLITTNSFLRKSDASLVMGAGIAWEAREQIGLVKTGAELRLKGYTAEAKARIEQRAETGGRDVAWSIPRLATSEEPLPKAVRDSRYAALIERKRRLRRRHEGDLMDARPAPPLVAWLRSRVIEHPDEEAVARGDVEPRFSPRSFRPKTWPAR